MFFIEIQTAALIWMKVFTEMVLNGGKVLGEFQSSTPDPPVQGA